VPGRATATKTVGGGDSRGAGGHGPGRGAGGPVRCRVRHRSGAELCTRRSGRGVWSRSRPVPDRASATNRGGGGGRGGGGPGRGAERAGRFGAEGSAPLGCRTLHPSVGPGRLVALTPRAPQRGPGQDRYVVSSRLGGQRRPRAGPRKPALQQLRRQPVHRRVAANWSRHQANKVG
jgi:hypothetical protein